MGEIIILGTLPDNELRTAHVLHDIMKHLTFNILAELPTEDLYSSQFHRTPEENDFQLETRLKLVRDICSILETLATVPTIGALGITWMDQRQQRILYNAILEGIVNTNYVNKLLLTTWENILEARFAQIDVDYEVPGIRVFVGYGSFPEDRYAGHQHLGILYPFDRDSIQNAISQGIKKNRRSVARGTTLRTTKPLPRYSRIYPQITSPVQSEDMSWKVFPDISFPDLYEVILRLAYNLVTNEYPQLKHMPYRRIIQACSGPHRLTNRLLGYVDPAILALKHRSITIEM